MKWLLISIVSIVAIGTVWQRSLLLQLSREEAALVETTLRPEHEVMLRSTNLKVAASDPSVSEPELEKFREVLLQFRELRKSGHDERAVLLCTMAFYETLSRLSAAQLSGLIDSWTEGAEITGKFMDGAPGLLSFAFQAASVNPSATLAMLGERHFPSGDQENIASAALSSWLGRDPQALLAWVNEGKFPAQTEYWCRLWADAARTVLDPSSENVRSFLSHRSNQNAKDAEQSSTRMYFAYFQTNARAKVVEQLASPEARAHFFASLHEATSGVSDELQSFIQPLAQRMSFYQLAQLADSVPSFQPSGQTLNSGQPARPVNAPPRPAGSLRFEVACGTRDGTPAERWTWLTQRQEDRPAGPILRRLVGRWCSGDYPATAAWVRTLPAGPERDAVVKTVVQFLGTNEAGEKFLAEWKAP